jgi:tRNA dimethylallyltransferase
MSNRLPKLIVILGPTASGKSKLALKLAKKINGEVVSADSRQIYGGMDIGTAKIEFTRTQEHKNTRTIFHPKTAEGIPHHMIDIVNPDEEYTLAQYKKQAIKVIKNIQKRGKMPFLVGGTGLYIQVIVDNLQIPKVPPNKALRSRLKNKSNEELLAKLKKLDPESTKQIDPHNKRRLIRAIEVCKVTGQAFSQQIKKGEPLFDVLQIGIKVPREELYKRINLRVEKMIRMGLVEEVKKLTKTYSFDLPSMSGIGYKEIIMYLQGKIGWDEAKELIKRNTRRYARRQMTWFRGDRRIKWVEGYKEGERLVKNFAR